MSKRPNNTPTCCDTPAKWIEQTQNLAYFYCSVCKTEPKDVLEQLPFGPMNFDNKALDTHAAGYSGYDPFWAGNSVPNTPPPPVKKLMIHDLRVGMRVKNKVRGVEGSVWSINLLLSLLAVVWDGDVGETECFPSEITLVP